MQILAVSCSKKGLWLLSAVAYCEKGTLVICYLCNFYGTFELTS